VVLVSGTVVVGRLVEGTVVVGTVTGGAVVLGTEVVGTDVVGVEVIVGVAGTVVVDVTMVKLSSSKSSVSSKSSSMVSTIASVSISGRPGRSMTPPAWAAPTEAAAMDVPTKSLPARVPRKVERVASTGVLLRSGSSTSGTTTGVVSVTDETRVGATWPTARNSDSAAPAAGAGSDAKSARRDPIASATGWPSRSAALPPRRAASCWSESSG
jgi:hypothetical protein